MVNKTPLRLVALEEFPPPGADEVDDTVEEVVAEAEEAAPEVIMTEHDAITRKVPEAEVIAAAETQSSQRMRTRNLKLLLLIGGAALGVVVAAVMVMVRRGTTPVDATPAVQVAPAVEPAPAGLPHGTAPAQAPAAARIPSVAAAEGKGASETIRLEITVDPVEAELSLDGNVLAGHRLNLQVPKDRGIHVLSASARGYVPFNQQVSFSNDVVLSISLRRGHGAATRPTSRARAAQNDGRSRNDVRPASVQPERGMEPGMNLEGPSPRPAAKSIDERNPYKP
jgi:hypothetical protein